MNNALRFKEVTVHYFNISVNKFRKAESYTRLPLLPPGLLVPSWGTGVTSSIRSMRKPNLARARMAA
jgi:hypothetical protein